MDNQLMRETILNSMDQPRILENLYQEHKNIFINNFIQLYPQILHHPAAIFWNERLQYENRSKNSIAFREILYVILLAFLSGIIAKLPDIFGWDPEFFFPRNISFIVFPALGIYFLIKNPLQSRWLMSLGFILILLVIYINFLPGDEYNDTLILACIHLPLLLWSLLGFIFSGGYRNTLNQRMNYLRYNGDLIIMSGLLLIGGAILSGVTISLFALIGLSIEEFYMQNFGIIGLAAIPVVATHLVQSNPQLVKNVSPVIARVFTPLVFVMLFIYLVAMINSGKDPYNDREFLMIFNALLAGVMAIIVFSISETSVTPGHNFNRWMLTGLSLLTILVNGIALSAIVFRISEWGITPNRLAVLGGNILMLVHLLWVTGRLIQGIRSKTEDADVEKTITRFLPVYFIWSVVVVFLFPILFGFR